MNKVDEKIIAGALENASTPLMTRWELGKQYHFEWVLLSTQEKAIVQEHKAGLIALAQDLYAQFGSKKPLRVLDPANQLGVTIYGGGWDGRLQQATFYSLKDETIPPVWIIKS